MIAAAVAVTAPLVSLAGRVLRAQGYDVVRRDRNADIEPEYWAVHDVCKPYTMTTLGRMYALYQACAYVSDTGIAGSVVECGVWKGGSSMLAAMTLLARGDTSREILLFDTFQGMVEPSKVDVRLKGQPAHEKWRASQRDDRNEWCYAGVDEVRRNMLRTGYPPERLTFVEGDVRETIPSRAPPEIALLRLDTDWYESTKHELRHLYPRLTSGGVLLIDDYGQWEGAKKAVDEYFAEQSVRLFLHRVEGGRVAVKP